MGKHRRITFILLSMALLGGLAWFVLNRPEPEPVYQGKTLSQWMDNYSSGIFPTGSSGISPEADEAIGAMGTNAIPHLLRMVAAHDSSLKLKLVDLAQRQGLFKIHFVPASRQKPLIIKAFKALGVQGRPAAPELIAICEHNTDPLSRATAASILGGIGRAAPESVPILVRLSTNTNEPPAVRNASIHALRSMRTVPPQVVPALIQIAKEPSAEFRQLAVFSLHEFGPDAKAAFPTLFNLLVTQGKDPAAIAEYRRQGQDLNSMNLLIFGALRSIDPEATAARSWEIDAILRSGQGQ